jgi:uncharacterized membrane protein YfcA
MLELPVLVALGFAGLAAGFVDAVAGGGGLIGIPALLLAGVPPVSALATNKLQGVVGTAVAAITYWRRGLIDLKALAPAFVTTLAGGVLGASMVRLVDTSLLRAFVPIALIAIAGYFLLAPNLSDADRTRRLNFAIFVPVMGFGFGFYDGVFGPGTGSFFTIAFVTLFGLGLLRASGHTKALNFTSNFAALLVFVPAGDVLWPAAIAMAIGQVAGGYIGARAGIRFGAKLIKPVVVVVSCAMALRLLFGG